MKLAIVVPMLNEERAIAATLRALRRGAPDGEIIVVDGGSRDDCVAIASPLADVVISAPRGRARQMNTGAATARAEVLAFVHADTIVPADFARQIEDALEDPRVVGGRFDVLLDASSPAYEALGTLISWRSRIMRSATGDQAIFVRRDVFARLGGFAAIDLCEDVDFARRLRHAGRLACLRARVITSARRWQSRGLIRTVLTMWTLKSLFLLGVSPAWLQRRYFDAR